MSTSRKELDAAILSELQARLAALRDQSYEVLAGLPVSKMDDVTVLGKRVQFTVYCDPQTDGRLLILVRSDKPIFFRLGTAGTTEGFWALPTGEKQDAYEDEISEFFA